ncbi:peptidoglycan DD-metalloendopeptidase family protein [Treponema sp.]|uniref:peptidoglycan DD-metalloendopeptidase family protein n=1 Tax=Treponema sp. TaxID=166 RepID=UPI0025DC77BA|nr:M23 family metallopeptidase [Treponema sp.]MCR5218923.1 M23 family metallopeptidase [Treponema sp.]
MKKIELFKNMCYSKRIELKLYMKNILISGACTLGAAAIVAAGTFAFVSINHPQEKGEGGYEKSAIPTHIDTILAQTEEISIQEPEEVYTGLAYFSYRVKQGEVISKIASSFGISEDTITSVNNITAARRLQIGQYLKIPTMSGILYTVRGDNETSATIAEKFEVSAEKCAMVNNITQDQVLEEGKTLFVPDALMDRITKLEINGDLFKKPLKGGYYFSSRYGWRTSPFDSSRRSFHSGIDMACRTGTPIYAALDGRVTTAGWSDIYGNYVIVTHHSGYKTLYGHMNSISVKKGAYVTTSTVLGKVGSTGLSTGPHLHFSVYKNNRTVNPADLW